MKFMLKKIIKKVIVNSGFITLLINVSGNIFRILMYHGVSKYSLPIEQFEKQLNYVNKYFHCYWVSEIARLLKERPQNKPILFLTFDDGLKNNFKNVVPILKKYNVKATFYITSNLLNNSQMLWNHEMRCLLMMIKNEELPETLENFSNNSKIRWREVKHFVEGVKRWDALKRQRLLEELKAIVPYSDYPKWMKEKFELMSKDDILNLPDIIEVGSHTCSHPLLSKLSDEESKKEIQNSARYLKSLIGKDIETFCYPEGDFLPRDVEYVKEIYNCAVSVKEGFAGNDLFVLKRIPAANNYVDFIFRLIKPDS